MHIAIRVNRTKEGPIYSRLPFFMALFSGLNPGYQAKGSFTEDREQALKISVFVC